MEDDTPAALGALRVDEGKLRGHVDEVVRSSVGRVVTAIEPDRGHRLEMCERNVTSSLGFPGNRPSLDGSPGPDTKSIASAGCARPRVCSAHRYPQQYPGFLRVNAG
jgi:hypothetical protein